MPMRRPGRGQRWARWVLAAALSAAVVVGVTAVERSVTVQIRWNVLPYQTLRVEWGSGDPSSISYVVRGASALDRERGYIEDENALRLDVISNIPWKVQVRAAAPTAEGILLRQRGGEYARLTAEPHVLAHGRNGSYEIAVDYRIPVDGATGEAAVESIEIVCTIMPD